MAPLRLPDAQRADAAGCCVMSKQRT